MLCASLLTDEPVIIRNLPDITDVRKILSFFSELGSTCEWDKAKGVVQICHREAKHSQTPLPEGMRSSVMLMGPLLARFGVVIMHGYATGCTLGVREIDPHLEVLEALGAREIDAPDVELRLDGQFKGCSHWLDYASVTTTEQFAMAAAVAHGESVIVNAASEPHVQDLCEMLVAMGAKIDGVGTSTLKISGAARLGGCDVRVSDDHHEVLTFLAIGAITGGTVHVKHDIHRHMPLLSRALERFGVTVEHDESGTTASVHGPLRIARPHTANLLSKLEGAPWPYFPVDLIPPMVALAAVSDGSMMFWNKVYEGAFGWIPELQKFGAHATTCDPHRVIVFGRSDLRPADVESPYIIRVIIALFMVASSIDGTSIIRNAGPVRRAHPNFVENLKSLGAKVEWGD